MKKSVKNKNSAPTTPATKLIPSLSAINWWEIGAGPSNIVLKEDKTAKVIEKDKMAKVKTLPKQTSSILDPAISDYLNALTLKNWDIDMERHFQETRRLADKILDKNMFEESFLAQIFLHKLPADFIGEIENRLPEHRENYTFAELSECMYEYFNSTVPENQETGTQY